MSNHNMVRKCYVSVQYGYGGKVQNIHNIILVLDLVKK